MNDDTTILEKEINHRRKVSKLIYSIWTENNDNNISGIACPWIDGRMDILGLYVTLSDYQDELYNNNNNKESQNINIEDGNELSYNAFRNKYMIPNKPVLIKNVCTDWNIYNDWITGEDGLNIEYISKMYGNDTVPIHMQRKSGLSMHKSNKVEDMTVYQYLQWYEQYQENDNNNNNNNDSDGEEEIYYLKDYKFQSSHPTKSNTIYNIPTYFKDDWLNPTFNNAYKFIYLGPKGTSTSLHIDVMSSYSWSSNIIGTKHWIIINRKFNFLLNDIFGNSILPHLFLDNNDMGLEYYTLYPGLYYMHKYHLYSSVMQHKGDTIFIPSEWHHTVENVNDSASANNITLSINHNWINRYNINYIWKKLQCRINNYIDNNDSGDDYDYNDDNDLSRLWYILSHRGNYVLNIINNENGSSSHFQEEDKVVNDNVHVSSSYLNDLLVMSPIIEWMHNLVLNASTGSNKNKVNFIELSDVQLLLSKVKHACE